jgi:hypothetical protein
VNPNVDDGRVAPPTATENVDTEPVAEPVAEPVEATTPGEGWVVFAGVIMLTLGAFEAMTGFVALLRPTYFLVTRNGLVVSADYTAWGWVHLALGAVALAAGVGVLGGQTWARVVGIVLAVVGAIVNLAFLAAYPAWSIIMIAVYVLIIYALAVHGGAAAPADAD